MKNLLFLFTFFILCPATMHAQKDTLYVYGPGGPFAPIDECAKIFGTKNNIIVKVTAGPESKWIETAKQNADLIYGGAAYMLTSFAMKYADFIDQNSRTELHKRGAAILVRPGNPKNIRSIKDLSKPGINILEVNGAGQLGLWEDIAGKKDAIEGIQKNIKQSFANTALGIAGWKEDKSFDAWINYESWHYRLKDITAVVKLRNSINVYRGTPIAITTNSKNKELSKQFIDFMKTKEGHTIFKKWGWK